MAEGKNSFVLYRDQKEIFEALSDNQAGKLIKHIFRYVSDENPTTDDEIVRALFIGIKQALKRDLKKWETKQEQRKRAGEESARKRKEAAKIAEKLQKNNLNNSTKSTTVNDRQHPSTVNVNGNGNGNGNGNVTTKVVVEEKEKEKEKKFDNDNILPIDVLIEKYLSDQRIVESVISNKKNNFKNKEHLEQRIELFKIHLTQNGQHAKSFKDFASHFRYWNLQESNKSSNANQNLDHKPPKLFR